MSADTAFTGPMTRHDAILLNKMGYAQTFEALLTARYYLQAIDPTVATVSRPQVLNLGSSYVAGQIGTSLWIFSFTGTNTLSQWIGHLLGSGLGPFGPGSGLIGNYFAANAAFNWLRVVEDLPTNQSKRVVFIGHSLGGALAEIMASNALLDGWTNVGLYVAGCPKVGNEDWVSQLSSFNPDISQLVNLFDPVPSLPPDQLLPWSLLYPYLLSAFSPSYAPIVAATLMDTYGQWSGATLPNMGNEQLIALLPDAAIYHVTAAYYAALLKQFGQGDDLIPGTNGYLQPCLLIDEEQGPAGCGSAVDDKLLPQGPMFPDPGQFLLNLACQQTCGNPGLIVKPLG